MRYNEMCLNLKNKYGIDSKELLKLRLMWLSYRGSGKVTFQEIEEYYNKKMNPTIARKKRKV